jgi:hypothetical protein
MRKITDIETPITITSNLLYTGFALSQSIYKLNA